MRRVLFVCLVALFALLLLSRPFLLFLLLRTVFRLFLWTWNVQVFLLRRGLVSEVVVANLSLLWWMAVCLFLLLFLVWARNGALIPWFLAVLSLLWAH